MKSANILSITSIESKETIHSYKEYLNVNLKEYELECLHILCDELKSKNPSISIFDSFYLSYSIPQISKEFDMLRINKENVVNIELKTESSLEKIKKQLNQNKYYLSYLNRNLFLFAFEASSKKLYRLEGEALKEENFDNLISILAKQSRCYSGNLNKLFNPSNYLVSPFNSTDKFLKSKYFLTSQQDEIKKNIITLFECAELKVVAVEGKAGTGKTLLLYDVAKELILKKKNTIIFHVGKLNDGHFKLRQNNYSVFAISELNCILSLFKNIDIIIIDECQRMGVEQYEYIINYANTYKVKIIFAFDRLQTLSFGEELSDVLNLITSASDRSFTLTQKIRTNIKIANFIKVMFDLKKHDKEFKYDDISIIYFKTHKEAKDYIFEKKGYEFINYTPSKYYKSEVDLFESNNSCSHSVLGQEFDNVIVWIDNHYYYDENRELKIRHPFNGNPYSHLKMLFQAVTRVKLKLELVVVNNEDLFKKLLKILTP